MRSVTYRLSCDGGYYDMWGLQSAGLPLQSIHDIDLLADGSLTLLFQTTAPPDRVREICERTLTDVMEYDVVGGIGSTQLHVHGEPSEQLWNTISLHRKYPVLTDYPVEYVDPGEPVVRVVKVGMKDDLNGMIEEMTDYVDVTVEQIGPYDPGSDRVFGALTQRQKTVLQTALDSGYYDVPRRTSCDALATELNCAPGTVSQHLRRIESTVFSTFHETPAATAPDESSP